MFYVFFYYEHKTITEEGAMPRPQRRRCIRTMPGTCLFGPLGTPSGEHSEVTLSLDEYEALRLADYEGLYQEAAALRMGVSRQTFGRILEGAHKKVAEALVYGKILRLEGGNTILTKEEKRAMKIAVPTRDGRVDSHFGHCETYTLFTVEEGKITAEETFTAPTGCGCKSGVAADLARQGVGLLIAGGIGSGAMGVLNSFGIQVISGASGPVSEVVSAYLAGNLSTAGTTCEHPHHHHHGEGAHRCGS